MTIMNIQPPVQLNTQQEYNNLSQPLLSESHRRQYEHRHPFIWDIGLSLNTLLSIHI